ncbi:hypothetical protein Cob_v001299 [Colletotrichum orbiculare MAFF 240422]|uniref:Fungal N-terminal domain-containing protein n=1 Tax=Colletotrichum orbiculare (strain 104-T / ATCC 96160 / CBS 514.97 / LARS 414 / MAFF 240422) TaxID=1213857 RepID=A0A484G890_COLOR|nr:hypothetical protein Cob_v001299 [Colletotrichum orbiculare MAFF 240422]
MAEILGTVVGVVSLGLQVCAGVNTYLDGVQCRKEDIESSLRCSRSTEALLKRLKTLPDRYPVSFSATDQTVQEALVAAEAELLQLDTFIKKIHTESAPTRSLSERMRDQKNKLLYPFRRDHLDRLDGRLDTANQMLRSALQLAELEVSASSGQIIRGVETGMDSLSQEVSTMHLNMQTSMQQIQIGTSTSQSNLVNIESKVDLSNLTLLKTEQDTVAVRRDVAEMKAIMEALLSSHDQALLPRLVSKPDVLRRIYDGTELSRKPQDAAPSDSFVETHQLSPSYASLRCQCKPRQSLKSSKGRKGPAFWKRERITDRVHSTDCPFVDFSPQSKSRWSVGLSINALRDIASIAITISMSTTFGAGGFAISPAFTYHPIRHKSPAVQVMGLLWYALGLPRRLALPSLWSDEDCNRLFHKGIKSLQTTLAAGKWSPLDVDRNGASLLAVAYDMFESCNVKQVPAMLLTFFRDAGVQRGFPATHRERLTFAKSLEYFKTITGITS